MFKKSEKETVQENETKLKEETKEKKKRTPQQKKKTRRIIIFSILGVLILYIVINSYIASHTPMTVFVSKLTKGNIEQTVNTSGTVSSLESKVYFAPIDGIIGDVVIKKGDAVKSGDVLYLYDETDLNEAIEQANLKIQQADGSYNKSLQENSRIASNLNEALATLPVLEDQIAFAENYIDQIEKRIEDKKAAISHEGALLQISLIDWRDQPNSDEYINLQKQVQENEYQQQHNKDIEAWQEELEDANEILDEIKTMKSEMKSQKNSSKDNVMTSGGKQELQAGHESTVSELSSTLEDYEGVKGGITADFNGVITDMSAISGSTVTKGTQMLKLESTEDVVMEVNLSKFDLENIKVGQAATITVNGNTYTGKVDHINKMAEVNQSGASVVAALIKIDNPDENIVLGLEGKASVLVGEASDVLLIGNGLINYDSEGAFVYTVDNGIVTKKHIVLGLVNDILSEVKEGLSTEDDVIVADTEFLEEGIEVMTVAQ